MNIFLSLLVAVVGAIIYIVAANPKMSEMGRLSFTVGLLAFLFQFGPHTVAALGK